MPNTPLTDPFMLHISHDNVNYDLEVTYARSEECCENLFAVRVLKPLDMEPFDLKEKPTRNPAFDHMVWSNGKNEIKPLYQEIGYEIEQHLKKHLKIFLIDAPLNDSEDMLEK